VPFNSSGFFLFLAVVLVSFYAAPVAWRRYLLIGASYFFYGFWNPRFIPLLLALTAIDYTAALWLMGGSAVRRRAVLLLTLGANFGCLGFFKYYNFFAANSAWMLGRPLDSFALDIALPLGISFHTFQSVSYVVDVYRGDQKPIRDPFDYALFICFFPQLVAGPIVRAGDFFDDLFHWKRPDSTEVAAGLFQITLGLTKKMAFADQFAKIANGYFGNLAGNPGIVTAWSGVAAFSLQIYFDFSGYTDIAIGAAKLFGFHFPVNFRRPYLAASISDFWRRWHISFSTWLRDYLWFPLGGSRHGLWHTCRNLLITMFMGGLWHGASWNFVIWGGYHGALLSVESLWRGKRPTADARDWLYPAKVVLTFGLVTLGWVFFRATDFPQSLQILKRMFTGDRGRLLFESWHLALILVALVSAIGEERAAWCDRLMKAPPFAYATALTAMFLCLEIFGVTDATIPFVYFQF
jgi:D-alanyl-lipoteichoic acid acyltransferase DltB (MBOAT superfamily)